MGPGDTPAAGDLDALIGDIRREAASRRAAPDFPLDEEARLSADMDGQGPAGTGGADLAAIAAALRQLERTADGKVAQVAGLAASAVRALSVRLGELERHAPTRRTPVTAAAGAGIPPEGLIEAWADEVAAVAAGSDAGRVLVIGTGDAVDRWVARLGDAGSAVYGLDGGGQPFGDRDSVRSGDAVEHLRSVGPAELSLTVVVGPQSARAAESLDALAGELVRTSKRVVVCSESPWAWRQRVGDATADTSAHRPMGPEAWLQALSLAGATASGRFDGTGLTYMLATARVAKASE